MNELIDVTDYCKKEMGRLKQLVMVESISFRIQAVPELVPAVIFMPPARFQKMTAKNKRPPCGNKISKAGKQF
jgi:hypothetical protein